MINILKKQLDQFNITLDDNDYNKIDKLVEIITLKNKEINLVSKNSLQNIYIDHIADSLSFMLINLSEHNINSTFNLIDLGSGAGFPAILIALLYQNSQITMVESTSKKTNFIKETAEKLELTNISVINERIEILAHNTIYREAYNISTARALSSINTLLEYSLPFLKNDGILVAYKTERELNEINNTNKALLKLNGKFCKSINYKLIDKDLYRTLLIFKKTGTTDNKYPRDIGIPLKKPL